MAAIKVFRAECIQRGAGDYNFLQRVFHKLLLDFSWWINRKDAEGHNLFEGGFMGLDNISVYNRSKPLPPGYSLKQADATGWMAHFALKMALIALELCVRDPDYEDIAIHCYKQFLAIAEAIAGSDETGAPSLWDPKIGFFTDLLRTPDQGHHRIEVYSWVGLIPLFAVEIVNRRMLEHAPRFRRLLDEHKGGLFHGSSVCACPDWENERGERLLALVDHTMLPRILQRLLDEEQFLSRYGVRSLSRIHATDRHLGWIPGIGEALNCHKQTSERVSLRTVTEAIRVLWVLGTFSMIRCDSEGRIKERSDGSADERDFGGSAALDPPYRGRMAPAF